METFVEPGSTVLVPEPTFSMYRFFSEVAGARVETVRYDEAMRFPLEATLRALRGRRAFYFWRIRIIPQARCWIALRLTPNSGCRAADAGAGGRGIF